MTPSKQREGVHTAKRSLLDLLNASAGPLPPFAEVVIPALRDEKVAQGVSSEDYAV